MRALMAGMFLSVVLPSSGCGGEPGEFSPLIGKGSAGHYDITVANVPSVRGAELAPGAEPGRPVIDGDRATRRVHLVATYSGDPDPAEIGEQMLDGLAMVDWLTVTGRTREAGEEAFVANVTYDTKTGEGTLRLELRKVSQPGWLEVLYEVNEER